MVQWPQKILESLTGKHCDFDVHDRLAIHMFLIKAIFAYRTETTKKDYLMKYVAQFPPKGCEILIFFVIYVNRFVCVYLLN